MHAESQTRRPEKVSKMMPCVAKVVKQYSYTTLPSSEGSENMMTAEACHLASSVSFLSQTRCLALSCFCFCTGWTTYLENQENKTLGAVEAEHVTLCLMAPGCEVCGSDLGEASLGLFLRVSSGRLFVLQTSSCKACYWFQILNYLN